MRQPDLRYDLIVVLGLFVLSLLFFWPVTMGGKSLLPADNVFAWQPWKSYAAEAGVGVPHNALLGDLYIQNYAWKRFIRQSLQARQIPLWNPYILSGAPFLAGGQHSAMYPPSALFYVLPLWAAYGWYAALHLFLAGLFTYGYARTLAISRLGGAIAALSFSFGGFIVIGSVFPMIVGAAVWLPLILACIERIVAAAERGESAIVVWTPEVVVGAAAVAMVFLAGHAEMDYYVCLIAAAYALWRLGGLARGRRSLRAAIGPGASLLALGVLGLGLGAAQWLPLLDLVRHNFREGSASFQEVLGWAYPLRHAIAFVLPDFYGNPAHHGYLDLFSWARVAVTENALGESIHTVFWGAKNYVEGACYVGALALILAPAALLGGRARQRVFFALLALVALLFAFGSPLYIVVYKLPGLNQVHSPFRWVYAYSLSAALLAGMGLDALARRRQAEGRDDAPFRRLGRVAWFIPRLALAAGVGIAACLALGMLFPEQAVSLADTAMRRLPGAESAFSDGRMFLSYQFRNLAILGGALVGGGALLCAGARLTRFGRPWARGAWGGLLALVLAGELFLIGKPFFPATRPELIGYRTPAIDFLSWDPDLFRITSYVGGSEKPLNANTPWLYDIQDVRGYDSIIPRQYAETMEILTPQSELLYNRIAPLFNWRPEALDAPLLDMLNVKYIVTNVNHTINARGYSLAYDGEVRIYRNEEALPRAFLAPRAVPIPDPDARREALRTFDPREVVILEEPPPYQMPESAPSPLSPSVSAIHYTPNEVTVAYESPAPCFLVLGDSYADGWLAFVRPADSDDPSLAERSLRIYRANGAFRAVAVPAGPHVVRFKYSPNPVKFGLFISFLSGAVLLLGVAAWAWVRLHARRGASLGVEGLALGTAQRVALNTVAPIALNLVNKIMDMAFAMLMLRILGPVDAGHYYLAVVVVSWFDILVNFGLNTLVTRDVARDPADANRYLSNTIVLRAGLWGASLPVLLLFFGVRHMTRPLEPAAMLAMGLFLLGLLPSNVAASYAAVFTAYERMDIPAAITTVTTFLRVILGTAALMLSWGYVGLAGVSIAVNVVTMLVLYALLRRMLFEPTPQADWPFQRRILRESYPLMINLLLATLFFKVAVLLLEWLEGARVVGWYSTAYKYVDAVQLVPSYFTIAIFPLMARYAATSRDALLRAYVLAVKLLVVVALPLATVGWALSYPLIGLLGGSQYLPHAAWVLRAMVWYMPLGFINSVTQYVLISLNQQRFLTWAFLVGLGFTLVANVVLIRQFGYMASAYVAIASELALLIPFAVGVRRHLAAIPWLRMLWKPVLCAAPMIALWAALPQRLGFVGLLLGGLVYTLGLGLLRAFDPQERHALRSVLPWDRMTRWMEGLRSHG